GWEMIDFLISQPRRRAIAPCNRLFADPEQTKRAAEAALFSHRREPIIPTRLYFAIKIPLKSIC
ncbi:TPA: hypothetical protein ACQSN1_006358, partial [Pseudomonas aeruginosa]